MTAAELAHRTRRLVRPRTRLVSGLRRVRTSWWSIGQSALGGALAWEAAVRLLHHQAPLFASVAAIVCLSISHLNRLRRVLELSLGVTVGVGLGDLIVGQIGRGGWQLGAVVLLAMTAGLILDGGALIVNQAALQAVFVAVLPPPSGGYVGRWEDALLGGLVALVIAFTVPADPRPAMRHGIGAVVAAVAGALHESAAAARAGDVEHAFAALERARATQSTLRQWEDAVRSAEEISRLSPLRRRAEPEIVAHRGALRPLDRADRNLRVALRRVVASVEDDAAGAGRYPAMPAAVLDRMDAMAGLLHTVPAALLDPSGEGGRRLRAACGRLAVDLDPAVVIPPMSTTSAASSMSATVVLAQVRSALVDLLQLTGLSEPEAKAVLRG